MLFDSNHMSWGASLAFVLLFRRISLHLHLESMLRISEHSPSPLLAAFARTIPPTNAVTTSQQLEIEDKQHQQPEDDPNESSESDNAKKRSLQHVSTRQARRRVVKWMQTDADAHGIDVCSSCQTLSLRLQRRHQCQHHQSQSLVEKTQRNIANINW